LINKADVNKQQLHQGHKRKHSSPARDDCSWKWADWSGDHSWHRQSFSSWWGPQWGDQDPYWSGWGNDWPSWAGAPNTWDDNYSYGGEDGENPEDEEGSVGQVVSKVQPGDDESPEYEEEKSPVLIPDDSPAHKHDSEEEHAERNAIGPEPDEEKAPPEPAAGDTGDRRRRFRPRAADSLPPGVEDAAAI